ncbi:MAG: hypothetical protein GY809_25095, partial [Planctomycetes bacterium]|nr:hypothetical protein [Planctomycetota bacterium]
ISLGASETESLGSLNNGITGQDNASGSGYIMFSEQDVYTRFASNPPYATGANHLVTVKYTGGQWTYDNNYTYVAFPPLASDLLLAAVDFSADVVTNLQGSSGQLNGIESGYLTGNVVFTPNIWVGVHNPGEFGVTGSWFERNQQAYLAEGKFGVLYVDTNPDTTTGTVSISCTQGAVEFYQGSTPIAPAALLDVPIGSVSDTYSIKSSQWSGIDATQLEIIYEDTGGDITSDCEIEFTVV